MTKMFSDEQLFELFKKYAGKALVFRYKGDPPFHSETYHIFIILHRTIETGELLLVNGSSKFEKRLLTLERMDLNPEKTLVDINPGAYSFFPERTAIDCNTIHSINLKNLKLEDFSYVPNGIMSDDDMSRIVSGVKNSSMVSSRVKDLLS